MDEYTKKIKDLQTDKNKKVIFLYANNAADQHSYIQAAKNRGYEVLIMDTPLSAHFIGKLEQKMENTAFTRVDAATIDKLIDKDEKPVSKLSEKDIEKLKPVIEAVVSKEKFNVVCESLSEKDQPITITQPEFSRRMKDMNELGGGMMGFGQFPEMYNVVVNSNHPLISRILDEKDKNKQNKLAKQTTDLAMLSQNMLKGEDLTQFINRSLDML